VDWRQGELDSLRDFDVDLRMGEPDGARMIVETVCVPAFVQNERLRVTTVKKQDSIARTFLAYALLDGTGVLRSEPPGFWRPLVCPAYEPHKTVPWDLLLPTPKAWPSTIGDLHDMAAADPSVLFPNMEWCLDDWFPEQPDACWVVREAEDSKPLQESFLLMPAREKSDRPLFLISLFAETEPEQLVEELAAVHGVPAKPVLESPEAMSRLEELYARVKAECVSIEREAAAVRPVRGRESLPSGVSSGKDEDQN
jgi:hypothetical protein